MTYRVVFTAKAMADVIEQFRYLADRSPAAAVRWYEGIEKAVAKLGTRPERHPIAPDETEQFPSLCVKCSMAAALASFAYCFRSRTMPSPCTMSATVRAVPLSPER